MQDRKVKDQIAQVDRDHKETTSCCKMLFVIAIIMEFKSHHASASTHTTTTPCSNKSSAVAEMGDRLATIDMDPKVGRGLLCPFPWRSWVPI